MEELKKIVDEHIESVKSGKYHEDDDDAHYIYEAAVEAFYGKEVWELFK